MLATYARIPDLVVTLRFIKDLLTARWLWITVSGCIAVPLSVFPAVDIFLRLPGCAKLVGVICLLVAAAVAAGYRDYRSS